MHDAACSGDADKFFAHVAQEALLNNMINRMNGEEMAFANKMFGADGIRLLARSWVEQWRKDIERGKNGDACGWAFVRAEKIADEERVEVRSRGGEQRLLYFAKIDGKLKLVQFRSVGTRSDMEARNDNVIVAKDWNGTVEVHGDIRGKERAYAGGDGEAAGYSGGMSYEAVLNNSREEAPGAPSLTDTQLSAPLRHASFIVSCGAPDSMKVTVRVAVRRGRAVGVTVNTSPPVASIAACIDWAVRKLRWAESAKTDFVTTTY